MASQGDWVFELSCAHQGRVKKNDQYFLGPFNLLCQLRSKQVINLPFIRDVAFSEVGSDETVLLCNSYGYYYCGYCF